MNTAGVTNMAMLFHSCLALTSVDVSGFNTSSVTDMQSMFQYCRQLTMADLSTFDTSSLTNMYCMFYECYALEVVDLTGWLTPALTNMSHTFYACTKVNTIYATDGKWDASKLNNTINTFGACYKIVGGNGTPYGVVAGTYALVDKENQPGYFTDKTLVGAGFAVYSDDDTEVVIYGPGITPRPGDTYDGRYVTAVDGSLESLDGLAAYKTKATAIRMKGKVDFPGTSMYQYLYAWSALKTVDFSLMNTAGVTNMAMLFHSCLALTSVDVSGFNTSSVTDMQSMFQYCRVLTKVDLSMFKTPKLTNMFCMFYECYALEEVSLAGWSTPALTNMSHTFYACSKLRTIYATDGKWDNSKISDGNNAFAGCGKLTGGNGTPYSEVGSAYAVIDKDGQSGYLTDNSHVSSGFGVFSTDDNEIILYSGDVTPRPGTYYDGRYVTAVDGSLESLDGLAAYRTVATAIKMKGKVDFPGTSMYQYLYGWSALRTVDFSLMNTAGVTNMAMLFHSCTALTSVDVSGFDTSSVTDMQSMFQYCRVLTKVDLSNFKTPKLANMFCMFYECYALEEVNLKGWNTPALTNMSHTFYACSKLRTIYATDGLWDSSKISTGSNAFGGCTNIIGGNGTYYSAVDSSYAKIDKDGQVGYLTEDTYISSGFGVYSDDDKKVIFYAGDVTPRQGEQYDGRTVTAVDGSLESLNGLEKYKTVATAIEMKAVIVFPGTSMASYLSGWTALRTVDFSRLDTKNVTSMYMAFYACSKLETVDLSGFDTGNVTTMACMFQYCTNLKSLDMSMFDVRKVTTTYCMIYECRYLETVDISGWETASLTNMSHMFYGSSVLTTIYATDTFSVSKLSDGSRAFGACPKLTGGAGTICSDESSSYAYVDSDERKGYFTDRYLVTAGFGVYSVDDNELIFYSGDVTPRPGTTYKGRTVTAVDGSIADLNGLANYKSAITRVSMKNKINFPGTTMYQYFYGWPKLASVELSRMDTSNVTSMNMLFAACTTLETVDISGFKTHNVTDMASMFQTCVVLKAIDMSYFDLSKVTTMYCMIYECYKLETVDFTGCTTPSLTNVSHLFYNSLVLTTIYATDGAWDMSKVSVDTNMFAGCSKLVGGNGTTYSVAGRTYARVDKDGQAGYFTDRALQASTAALLLEESSEEASSSMAKGRADAPFVEGESALAQDSQVTPSENLAKEDVASSGEAAAVK
jgi:surface protein